MKRFNSAIAVGLAKQTHESATVKCYPTYIQDLPTGKGNSTLL